MPDRDREKARAPAGRALQGDTQPVRTQPVRITPAISASTSDPVLGRLIFAYRPPRERNTFKWIWGVGGPALSLAALSYGGYLGLTTYERFGPVPALSKSIPWFLLGVVILFTWIIIIILRWVRTQPGVRLYANGLFIESPRNRSLTWGQIDGIAQGITACGRFRPDDLGYRASLYPCEGRPIHLHGSGDGKAGMPNLPELVSRIKAGLYPTLQVELARMFREGLPLRFGPVRIDKECLKVSRRGPVPGTLSVPWERMNRITVQSGNFLVESSDHRRPIRLPVSEIPNLELLLKIIDQCVQQ
jgi:hypothetical protein